MGGKEVLNFIILGLGALLYIYSAAKGIEIPDRTDTLFPMLALQYFSPVAGLMPQTRDDGNGVPDA